MKDTDLPLDSEKQICAHADMSDGIPRGICHGDSGGPLVTDGVQYGIVSYNYGDCGSVEYPDVFTRVAHYIDWIEDKL
ncbi:unnamed protein product [Psylliodes chrysocephalus]|nr:unnamed protein product [Psylliodes chrysocephala]